MAWIYQPIADIRKETIESVNASRIWHEFDALYDKFIERIKAEVDWKLYFGYCCWEKDYLYNYENEIITHVHNLYPDVPVSELKSKWKQEIKEWEDYNKGIINY